MKPLLGGVIITELNRIAGSDGKRLAVEKFLFGGDTVNLTEVRYALHKFVGLERDQDGWKVRDGLEEDVRAIVDATWEKNILTELGF